MKRNVLSDTMQVVEYIFDIDGSLNLISTVEIEKQSNDEYAVYVESKFADSALFLEERLEDTLSLLSQIKTKMQRCGNRFVISVNVWLE